MRLVVASHNLMHGLELPALLPHYGALRDDTGLDVLCVQENRLAGGAAEGERPAAHIARALGPSYLAVWDDGFPELAIVCDTRRVELVDRALIPLPRLARLRWYERLYIVGGKTRDKHALLAVLRPRDVTVPPVGVVCFHLDTAGDNAHRRAQVQRIADAVAERGVATRVVVCGDTNAFTWRHRRHAAALDDVLAPLSALGARDPETRATHFFARQNEPKLAHQLGVRLGRLGLDLPRRYDVVCTNLAVAARGQQVTPASDHDLVWAAVDLEPGAEPDQSTTGPGQPNTKLTDITDPDSMASQ